MNNPSDGDLEQLFRQCDSDGSGYLCREEVGTLCSNLGIGSDEADNLFRDLDHDGDGKIDFQDFKRGFDEFARQFASSSSIGGRVKDVNENEKLIDGEKEVHLRVKPRATRPASPAAIRRHTFTPPSASPLVEVSGDSNERIIVDELIENMKKMEDENRKLADIVIREKREHEQHLSRLEEEIDQQVRDVERRMKAAAKEEVEAERRSLRDLMRDELSQLQTQMAQFDKVEVWLKENNRSAEGDEKLESMRTKLQEALQENRQLRLSMLDTQTNVALIKSELGQLKDHYESRCKELMSEKSRLEEVLTDQQHVNRYLDVLKNTNRSLQDTNDVLKTALDSESPFISPTRSPQPPPRTGRKVLTRHERGSVLSDYMIDGGVSSPEGAEMDRESDESHDRPRRQDEFEDEYDAEDDDPFPTRSSRLSPSGRRDGKRTDDEDDSGIATSAVSDRTNWKYSRPSTRRPGNPRMGSMISGQSFARGNSFKSTSVSSLGQDSIASVGPPERTFKVIFVGDSSVGKSSFILRLTRNVFASKMSSTLGVDFQMFMMLIDERPIALQLWDTAGQERFRAITKSYFRKADGVVLMYDVTSESSFLNVRTWIAAAQDAILGGVPILIVGNKTDLRPALLAQDQKVVMAKQGKQMAEQYGVLFAETSVKEATNVVAAMEELTRTMMGNEDRLIEVAGLQLTSGDQRKYKCCQK